MYRLAASASVVDTVPFGSYRRTLIEQIGGYNEYLLTNEDYEFNTRIRKSNRRVWLDPAIRSIYFARSTFWELIRQYWRYGFWKWRMLRRFPDAIRWRQALPPLFVLSLLGLLLISLFLPPVLWLLALEVFLYFFILFLAGFHAAIERRKLYLLCGLPLAISAMHLAWGSGFLWSTLTSSKN
jgi:GT2 family glycosyltransferase